MTDKTAITRQYVTLKHTTPKGIHRDFMLEFGEILATWRIEIGPEKLPDRPAAAEKIFDHPKKFLSYEGPVNNGTGSVVREDKGVYKLISESDGRLEIEISAEAVSGKFLLERISGSQWKFFKSL